MEKIYAAVFTICFVLLMLSPIYIPMIIHYRRDKSIKVGNIYIRYGSSKKNPFTDVRQIFKLTKNRKKEKTRFSPFLFLYVIEALFYYSIVLRRYSPLIAERYAGGT